jgi:hypothetical protein
MQGRVFLTCLGLLVGSLALAQSTSSPSLKQQPPASAQVQSDTQSPADSLQTSDKSDLKREDSDRDHKTHVRLGGIFVSAGYAHFPDRFFYPSWPYGFYPYSFAYAPFFYGPLYAPYYGPFYGPYYTGFSYAPDKGEIKLSANPKDAQVYVDGAYAGTADHLKKIWLDSGAYNISISAPGRETFEQRIYVLSGKSLKIEASLASGKNQKPQTEEKP